MLISTNVAFYNKFFFLSNKKNNSHINGPDNTFIWWYLTRLWDLNITRKTPMFLFVHLFLKTLLVIIMCWALGRDSEFPQELCSRKVSKLQRKGDMCTVPWISCSVWVKAKERVMQWRKWLGEGTGIWRRAEKWEYAESEQVWNTGFITEHFAEHP